MKDIASLRKEIERTDSEIVRLMIRRNDAAKRIGDLKAELGLPLRNLDVEREVVERYRRMAENSSIPEDVSEAVCRILIESSVELQARALRKGCTKKITIIGGRGKMGVWMDDYFTSMGATVNAVGRSYGGMSDAKDSDVVIVSVPISSTLKYLKEADEVCKEDALIFDISSIKSPLSGCLKEMAGRRKVCSVHPMFGPSAASLLGRNVVVCDCGCKAAVSEASELFDNDGSNIIITSVERHDELMAYVLGFAHASNITFFTALRESGIPFSEMRRTASTTFKRCMDTFIPVSEEDASLYHQIQRLNANAEDVWRVYENAFNEVKEASLSNDPQEFIRTMERGRDFIKRTD